MMTLSLAAFRCPGPDPLGDQEGPAGGGGEGGVAGGPVVGGEGGGGGTECVPTPNGDEDGDGWTEDAGDCDDCDPDVHPGAAELPLQAGDENCNDEEDEEPDCEPLPSASALTPETAARVIDICDPSVDAGWGLEQARFVRSDGTVIMADNLMQMLPATQFGVALTPRVGDQMLVMSTGRAVDASHPEHCPTESCGNPNSLKSPPAGFPIPLPGCQPSDLIADDVALEVEVRPPPNAEGFEFHTTFLTHEYPEGVCSPYRDQFLALQLPAPQGWPNANMIFDKYGIPPSAEFQPFPHCNPLQLDSWAAFCGVQAACPEPPLNFCPAGPGLLEGTGFEGSEDPNNGYPGGAATGWMSTLVELEDHEPLKIRFVIFNTGDSAHDSTALIDGFTWVGPSDFEELPVTEVE